MPDTRPGPLDLGRKLAARLKSRGFKEVLGLATARGKELLSSDEELVVFVRDAAGLGESLAWPDLIEATTADGPRYARDIGTDSPSTFAARLSDGTRCFLVVRNAVIVHATWMTTRAAWTRELNRYFRPPENDGYIYESYTRAEVRGQGTYPLALEQISARAASWGLARLWVAVEANNPSSLRAVAKAGFNEAWRVAYHRRLGRLTVDPPTGTMADLGTQCLASNKVV